MLHLKRVTAFSSVGLSPARSAPPPAPRRWLESALGAELEALRKLEEGSQQAAQEASAPAGHLLTPHRACKTFLDPMESVQDTFGHHIGCTTC